MHEISVARHLFEMVRETIENNEVKKVLSVKVLAGVLSGVVPESLSLYFEYFAQGTSAEGARVDIETIPLRICCKQCNKTFESKESNLKCPQCQGLEVEVVSGKELIIKDIEVI